MTVALAEDWRPARCVADPRHPAYVRVENGQFVVECAGCSGRPLGADEQPPPAFILGVRPGGRSTLDVAELLDLELPPREWIAEGLIQARDTNMIHAFRGVGKTMFTTGLGLAIASGTKFLRWAVPRPRPVLIVDGEMPREDLQERFRAAMELLPKPASSCRLLAADFLEDGIPSLATPEGQALVEQEISECGAELVILDSISTLYRTGEDSNSEEYWNDIQPWLLALRRRGVAVLLVQHDGKAGTQRGTTKKEDILSQVIQLRRPADYRADQGARFEVHFTKTRGIYGATAIPFEAQLRTDPDDGAAVWTMRPVGGDADEMLALAEDGMSQRAIAERFGVGVGTVNRRLRSARESVP